MKEFFRTSDHHCYSFEAKLLAAFNTFLICPLPTSPTPSFSILLKTSSQFSLYLESSGLCLYLNITAPWLPSLKLHTDSPAEYWYVVFMTTGNYLPCCICLSKLLKRIFFPPCFKACGILVPWLGIKSMPCAVESQSLNHSIVREVHKKDFFFKAGFMIVFTL